MFLIEIWKKRKNVMMMEDDRENPDIMLLALLLCLCNIL